MPAGGFSMLACLHAPKNSWLLLCRMYSELISAAIASGGPHASRTSQVKLMRSCKKVALKLIETFVEKCDDTVLLAQQIVPAMMDPILGDYARNVPDARSATHQRPPWHRCCVARQKCLSAMYFGLR